LTEEAPPPALLVNGAAFAAPPPEVVPGLEKVFADEGFMMHLSLDLQLQT
jgi:hypothetical protein